MKQLRAFSARRGFRSQLAASSALQRGGGSSTVQVIPVVAVRFAFWLDSTNVGITPTCTSYLGAESWASRRRGHHAYADGPDVYKRGHHAYADTQGVIIPWSISSSSFPQLRCLLIPLLLSPTDADALACCFLGLH